MKTTYYVIYVDFQKHSTWHNKMDAEIQFEKVVEENPWSIIDLDEFTPGHGSVSLKRHESEDEWGFHDGLRICTSTAYTSMTTMTNSK